MQWYKINLAQDQPPFGDAIDYINHLGEVIHFASNLNFDEIGIFSKLAHDNSRNVYFSEVAYNFLSADLVQHNPQKCSAPIKDSDREGNGLRLHYGNEKLLF